MQLVLAPKLIDKLAHMPEQGMGYQLVDLRLRDGRWLTAIVVRNGEFAQIPGGRRLSADEVVDVRLTADAKSRRPG
jgi:hypothetical protein